MKKIETNKAPMPLGVYSQAIAVPQESALVFVAGQIPLVPGSDKLIEGGIREQTRQVLDNLEAILEASGSSIAKVVKVEVFLKNLKGDYAGMAAEYDARFKGSSPPARQTVEVPELPKGALVEISCIAIAR